MLWILDFTGLGFGLGLINNRLILDWVSGPCDFSVTPVPIVLGFRTALGLGFGFGLRVNWAWD